MSFRLAASLAAALLALTVVAQTPTVADLEATFAATRGLRAGDSPEPLRRIEEWVRQSSSQPALRRQLEDALVKLLAEENSLEALKFACGQLGVIGGESSLPAIARLLARDETASIACQALSSYPSGPADTALREALKSARGEARLGIVSLLGTRRDGEAVNLLVPFLSQEDSVLAEATITALGKIGTSTALKALSTAAGATPSLRVSAELAVLECAQQLASAGSADEAVKAYEGLVKAGSSAHVRRGAFQALLILDEEHTQQRVLALLHGDDPVLKPVAIAAIRRLPAGPASEVFARELPSLAPDDQVLMIEALAARADPAGLKAVADSVGSRDPAVRQAAIETLGRSGDATSVAPLRRALASSPDREDRRNIEIALLSLPRAADVDQAIASEMRNASGAARALLLSVFAARSGAAANAVALQETANTNAIVRKAAFAVLSRGAAGSDLAPMLDRLDTVPEDTLADAEAACADVLTRIEDPTTRSSAVLSALRGSKSAQSRNPQLRLLAACGDTPALEYLKHELTVADVDTRETVVGTLADWPDSSAWDALAPIYLQTTNGPLRGVALNGLVRMAGDDNARLGLQLLPRYRQLISASRGEPDLRLILGALGGLAEPDALEIAFPFLQQPGVKPEAAAAIRRIAESIKARHPEVAKNALERLQ